MCRARHPPFVHPHLPQAQTLGNLFSHFKIPFLELHVRVSCCPGSRSVPGLLVSIFHATVGISLLRLSAGSPWWLTTASATCGLVPGSPPGPRVSPGWPAPPRGTPVASAPYVGSPGKARASF